MPRGFRVNFGGTITGYERKVIGHPDCLRVASDYGRRHGLSRNSPFGRHFLHDMVLKNLCSTMFLFLTALRAGAYYARRVGKSGSKWTLQSTWRKPFKFYFKF